MKATEIMLDVKSGWLYFKTDAESADKAFTTFCEALENAGIDVSNLDFGKCELRDEDGDTLDAFNAGTENGGHHFDCNHDCEALYEAYNKGRRDERSRIMKAIEGGR